MKMNKWFLCFGVILGIFTKIEAWVYRYHYYSLDEAKDMVYGLDGNIYVCGMSDNINGKRDIVVASLTPDGIERWIYRYNGPANDNDVAWAIVYGDDGNIYIAGHSCQSGSTPDFTVISLTSTGVERWIYSYNGAGNSYDFAFDIAYGNNRIYAVGRETDIGGTSKGVIICLDTNGNFKWRYSYDGGLNAMEYSIIYGGDGNIYATSSWNDIVVVSVTVDGIENWIYRYNYKIPGNPSLYCIDVPHFITYGSDGNIYVGGYSDITDGWGIDSIFTTIFSLTPSGNLRWQYNFYEGQATYGIDGAGDGIYYDNKFYFTTKSSQNGQLKVVGINSINGAHIFTYSYPYLSGYDYLYSIFIGGGFLYATGNRGGGVYNNIILFKVDPTNGIGDLVYTYDNGGSDVAYKGISDPEGKIYIAGYSEGNGEDFIVLGNVLVNIAETKNYKIFEGIQNKGFIIDIQGRIIKGYKNNFKNLKSGIYFLNQKGKKLNKILKIN